MAFFLISSIILGLLNQLQIFIQLHLIELLGILTGLRLLKLLHLIYPRLLTGFGILVFFTNVKSYGISCQIFSLISSFLSNRWLWVVLDGNSSQEYPVNVGVPQGSILGPTLFWFVTTTLFRHVQRKNKLKLQVCTQKLS